MALKKGLGKGLDALFSDNPKPAGNNNSNNNSNNSQSSNINLFFEIDILKIEPNRMQPRKFFDDEQLSELADSIKSYGVIQPIIVKKDGDYYSIIAGERRWRAARMAGLMTVPAVIKDYSDMEALEAALIENIQRADLNPIEEAICYQKLIDEYSFSQEQLAKRIGKNRSFISNSLRLLTLHESVKTFIIEGKLTMGHARTLIPIENKSVQFEMAEKIIDEELSVRETEELIRNYLNTNKDNENNSTAKVSSKKESKKSHIITTAESNLKTILGTNVSIKDGKNKGKIEIEYYSQDEFDRLLIIFNKLTDSNE